VKHNSRAGPDPSDHLNKKNMRKTAQIFRTRPNTSLGHGQPHSQQNVIKNNISKQYTYYS